MKKLFSIFSFLVLGTAVCMFIGLKNGMTQIYQPGGYQYQYQFSNYYPSLGNFPTTSWMTSLPSSLFNSNNISGWSGLGNYTWSNPGNSFINSFSGQGLYTQSWNNLGNLNSGGFHSTGLWSNANLGGYSNTLSSWGLPSFNSFNSGYSGLGNIYSGINNNLYNNNLSGSRNASWYTNSGYNTNNYAWNNYPGTTYSNNYNYNSFPNYNYNWSNNSSDQNQTDQDQDNYQEDIPTDQLVLEVHQLVNDYRSSQQLAPLIFNDRIAQEAEIHSENMATDYQDGKKEDRISHDGFNDRVQNINVDIPLEGAAENVGYNMGYSQPAESIVQGWINSDGHRENIEGDYNITGIGIYQDAEGAYYYTQIFVRTR